MPGFDLNTEVAIGACPGDSPNTTKGIDFSMAILKETNRIKDRQVVQMALALSRDFAP